MLHHSWYSVACHSSLEAAGALKPRLLPPLHNRPQKESCWFSEHPNWVLETSWTMVKYWLKFWRSWHKKRWVKWRLWWKAKLNNIQWLWCPLTLKAALLHRPRRKTLNSAAQAKEHWLNCEAQEKHRCMNLILCHIIYLGQIQHIGNNFESQWKQKNFIGKNLRTAWADIVGIRVNLVCNHKSNCQLSAAVEQCAVLWIKLFWQTTTSGLKLQLKSNLFFSVPFSHMILNFLSFKPLVFLYCYPKFRHTCGNKAIYPQPKQGREGGNTGPAKG